ncbi:response regulator, partial [Candidatus Omnitrophota bacterium]
HPHEGLHLINTFAPDVIITDIKMPDLDGFDIFKRMQKKFPHVPVIIVTGEGKLQKLFELEGVAAFISKPFKLEELEKKIYEVL